MVELSSYQIADLEARAGGGGGHEPRTASTPTGTAASRPIVRTSCACSAFRGVRVAVLNARDERLAESARRRSRRSASAADGWDATAAADRRCGASVLATSDELPLRGAHNALNVCAALAALSKRSSAWAGPGLPGALRRLSRAAAPARDGRRTRSRRAGSTTASRRRPSRRSPRSRASRPRAGADRRWPGPRAGLRRARAMPSPWPVPAVIGVPTTGPRLVAAARSAGVAASRAIDAPDLAAAVELARGLAARAATPGGAALARGPRASTATATSRSAASASASPSAVCSTTAPLRSLVQPLTPRDRSRARGARPGTRPMLS